MVQREYTFTNNRVNVLFDASFADLPQFCDAGNTIILTDNNVYHHHRSLMEGYKVIKIDPGEKHKQQRTADAVIQQLIELETDKQACIIGVGGGVVTDLAGYVASTYKRGIKLGFVPTSIMAMVDASLGGKNGIDVGVYKNMVGTIYQPSFILYDYRFLDTLPVKEWTNGFAEIIKHACIRDAILFGMLERFSLHEMQTDKTLIAEMIERNAAIKLDIVTADEFEKGDRILLNFGHTFGHAIENLNQIPHGHAISIGMVAACNLSEKITGLHFSVAQRVVKLLAKYHLPVFVETDHQKVFDVLKQDKKRRLEEINFVLLNKIGEAVVKPIPLSQLLSNIKSIL